MVRNPAFLLLPFAFHFTIHSFAQSKRHPRHLLLSSLSLSHFVCQSSSSQQNSFHFFSSLFLCIFLSILIHMQYKNRHYCCSCSSLLVPFTSYRHHYRNDEKLKIKSVFWFPYLCFRFGWLRLSSISCLSSLSQELAHPLVVLFDEQI